MPPLGQHTKQLLLVAAVAAFVAVAATVAVAALQDKKSPAELITEYYAVENAVMVSPHSLRKEIGAGGKPLLVDLRSAEEYKTAHIVGAISIPAYASPDKSDYGAVDRIVGSFRALQEANPGKPIVVYCYSIPCMTGRKIGLMLAEHGLYVKVLGIGWSEWRYYWNLWNHDGEKAVNPADYVATGDKPGVFSGAGGGSCPLEGAYGC